MLTQVKIPMATNTDEKIIEYKAKLNGVPVVAVSPRFSSRTYYCCKHICSRKSKIFKCLNCGVETDADVNTSLNLAVMGLIVNQSENSPLMACAFESRIKAPRL